MTKIALYLSQKLRVSRTLSSRIPKSFLGMTSSSNNNTEWRKSQLDRLQKKFDEPLEINSDEELQPMWKDMESRVLNRRTLTLEEAGGKSGRSNIRPTDEEAWLQAGMYDNEKGEGEK